MPHFDLRPMSAAMLASGLGLCLMSCLAHAQSQPADAASSEQPTQRVVTTGQRERYTTPSTSARFVGQKCTRLRRMSCKDDMVLVKALP